MKRKILKVKHGSPFIDEVVWWQPNEISMFRNWLWKFVSLIPINVPILPQIIIGLLLYIGAIICAISSKVFKNPIQFFKVFPSVHWAILGIVWFLIVFRIMIPWAFHVVRRLRKTTEQHEQISELVCPNVSAVFDNKFCLLTGLIFVIFIIWRVTVFYPGPIPQFANLSNYQFHYNLLDWYTIMIFEIVMLILGSAVWMIFRGSLSLHNISKLHLKIELVDNLSVIIRMLTFAIFAWFVAVGICSVVLARKVPSTFQSGQLVTIVPLAVLIFQVGVGLMFFFVPQYYLHLAIRASKTKKMQHLRQNYDGAMKQMDETLKNASLGGEKDVHYYFRIIALDIAMRRVETVKEWFMGEPRNIVEFTITLGVPVLEFLINRKVL
ncbi:MAG: hypothetical protein ACLPVI_07210 [Dehalococcoidales bacterium]